ISKQKEQYKLVNYVSTEIPEGLFEEGKIVDKSGLAELIKSILAQNKINSQQVAVAVPLREAIIRNIAVPAELDAEELADTVLNLEAPLYLPYEREEVDLDFQKLDYFLDEDGIEKINVLLVATRREVTDLYVATMEEAGLSIDVLEINSFALMRTIKEQLRQFGSSEAVVLVNIEFDTTEISIIVDGVPQYSRTIPIGTFQLQAELSRAMNLPLARNTELLQEITVEVPETQNPQGTTTGVTWINPGMAALLRILGELSDEIGRSINFYLNQSGDLEIAQLLLAGSGGGLGKLDEFFSQRLNIPTIQIDPLAALALDNNSKSIPANVRPGLGTVLGLGLREV
ncbi:MAG: type IV pilus assembly protein PilM, partial [Cyanobacteria bacterium J083]